MELGPRNLNWGGLSWPNAMMVRYMDPLGFVGARVITKMIPQQGSCPLQKIGQLFRPFHSMLLPRGW